MGAGSSRKSCCNQKSFTNSRQQRSGGDSGNISKAEMARLSDGYRLVREEASGMILRFFCLKGGKGSCPFPEPEDLGGVCWDPKEGVLLQVRGADLAGGIHRGPSRHGI